MKKSRVLFWGEQATLAHITRPYLLAETLRSDVFEVHFACGDEFSHVLKNKEFSYHHIPSRSSRDFIRTVSRGGILFEPQRVKQMIHQDLELIRQVHPDLIVSDMRASLGISARISGIPLFTLTNGYWTPSVRGANVPLPCTLPNHLSRLVPKLVEWKHSVQRKVLPRILPRILAGQAQGINEARGIYGLKPFDNYFAQFVDGDRTILADIPPLTPCTEPFDFVGTLSWSPSLPLPDWWESVREKSFIYVGLGSSGDTTHLSSILRAIRKAGYLVVASGAAHAPEQGIFAAPYLPSDKILPFAAAAITNGGSPSSYQSLREGVPVIGIPLNMDQLLCMEGVERSGAGRSIRTDLFTPKRFTDALNHIEALKLHAAKLGCVFQQYNYRTIFPELVEQYLGITRDKGVA